MATLWKGKNWITPRAMTTMGEEENLVDHWKWLDKRVEKVKEEYPKILSAAAAVAVGKVVVVKMAEMFDR